MCQVHKTLTSNAFIAWRIFEREDILEMTDSFSIESYRNALNQAQSFADFILAASEELLAYAYYLQKEHKKSDSDEHQIVIKKGEHSRLIGLASRRRAYPLKFYNSTDEVAIRLSIQGHLPQQGLGLPYCAL